MGTVILISTVAIIVAIVGCFFIWRLDAARAEESDRLLAKLGSDHVVLLDERGQAIDSPSLSRRLLAPLEASRPVTVIIGGAYGVDASVHERALASGFKVYEARGPRA